MGSIFNSLFSKKGKLQKTSSRQDVLDIFTPSFSKKANPENNEIFLSAVNTHSKHFSKIHPVVMYRDDRSKDKNNLQRLLELEPNQTMNAAVFYESLCHNYFMYNNAFVYIDRDIDMKILGLYLIEPDANKMQSFMASNNKIYVSFIIEGKKMACSVEDMLIISRNVNPNDLFGKGNEAISQVLKVIQTNYEGIDQAIKLSSFIRFLVTSVTPIPDAMKQQKAEAFSKQFLENNKTGLVYVDSASQITPISSSAKYIDAEQMDYFKTSIFNYLGISEKIIRGEYTEDEWQAYYETSIEPLINKLEQEMERKILTPREYAQGNRIEISSNRLQTASLGTRIKMAETILKMPQYQPNQVFSILGLPKVEGGDEVFASLNYVKAKDQTAYQIGSEETEEGGKENE